MSGKKLSDWKIETVNTLWDYGFNVPEIYFGTGIQKKTIRWIIYKYGSKKLSTD